MFTTVRTKPLLSSVEQANLCQIQATASACHPTHSKAHSVIGVDLHRQQDGRSFAVLGSLTPRASTASRSGACIASRGQEDETLGVERTTT
jgi:hypothetical protein